MLSPFLPIIRYVLIITITITATLVVSSCGNKYYFTRQSDNFLPSPGSKYSIDVPIGLANGQAIKKIIVKSFAKMGLDYSNSSPSYIVGFNYKKRIHRYLVFRFTIRQTNNQRFLPEQLIYDILVYSYNSNVVKSILASLKIIMQDITSHKYHNNQYITLKVYLNKPVKTKSKSTQIAPNPFIPKVKLKHNQHLMYKLGIKNQ